MKFFPSRAAGPGRHAPGLRAGPGHGGQRHAHRNWACRRCAKPSIATFVGKGVDRLVQRTLAGAQEHGDLDPELYAPGRASFYRHYHLVNGEQGQ